MVSRGPATELLHAAGQVYMILFSVSLKEDSIPLSEVQWWPCQGCGFTFQNIQVLAKYMPSLCGFGLKCMLQRRKRKKMEQKK